jgi:hypothetical protein
LTIVQSLHVEPCIPQAESSMPELHDPFMSQHPMHVVAQPLAALPSPPALDASSPEEPPLSSPEGGVFNPGPVDVAMGGAASTAAPASCVVVDPPPGASRRESSPRLPLPPVAQATRMTRRSQPNPHVLGADEPMRKTSAPCRRVL